MKTIKYTGLQLLCTSILMLVLNNCGGGGGSDTPTTTNTPTNNLTLAMCEQNYASYDNTTWTNAIGNGPDKDKVIACYQALVTGPSVGMDSQSYIDAYNRGDYSTQIANIPISNDNGDTGSYSAITDLNYMKNHPTDKLSSSDCKAYSGGGDTVSMIWVGNILQTSIIQGQNSWSDVLSALVYDVAPADNMYKSILACQWVQTVVENNDMTYINAISTAKRNSPNVFSD